MNDINGNPGGSADTMSARLPDVARALKEAGVHHVIASYQASLIGMAFLDSDEKPMFVRLRQTHIVHVAEVFHSLLRKRHPTAAENINQGGIFDWDVPANTLEHQHTVTHRGL